MNNEMHTMFGTGMEVWMFFWWIFVIAVIAGAVLYFSRQQGNIIRDKSALDILKERYARGELSKQEFEEKKRDIL